jgi:hypothetical protein
MTNDATDSLIGSFSWSSQNRLLGGVLARIDVNQSIQRSLFLIFNIQQTRKNLPKSSTVGRPWWEMMSPFDITTIVSYQCSTHTMTLNFGRLSPIVTFHFMPDGGNAKSAAETASLTGNNVSTLFSDHDFLLVFNTSRNSASSDWEDLNGFPFTYNGGNAKSTNSDRASHAYRN